jgi:hypothetical protein
MHACSLHSYDPMKTEHISFISTVSENKEGFNRRKIKGAETESSIHHTELPVHEGFQLGDP